MSPATAARLRLDSAGWLPHHEALIPYMATALQTGRLVRFQKIDGHAVIDFIG